MLVSIPRLALACLLASALACSGPEASPADAELLSTYEPTPHEVVRRMLTLAEARPGDLLYDLGSGDGRIVIAAASDFKVKSLGFELDPELARRSMKRIQAMRIARLARIEQGDLMTADFSQPDVVTCYLTPEGLEKVAPKLAAELRPGARVVAYKFPLPGWTPEKTETMRDSDPEIPPHEIFLYRR